MKWIISNHKEGLGIENIKKYQKELKKINISNLNFIICPNFNELSYFNDEEYLLGSQDILPLEFYNNLAIKYTIVGHRDKRLNNQETNKIINEKIKILIQNNIIPILCIGEEKNENVENIIKEELQEGLKDINNQKIIIAYEPNWAIGNGIIPSIQRLKDIIKIIKQETIKQNLNIIILYGGSVNPETIKELEKITELDGYLIGSASLEIDKLSKIIEVIK